MELCGDSSTLRFYCDSLNTKKRVVGSDAKTHRVCASVVYRRALTRHISASGWGVRSKENIYITWTKCTSTVARSSCGPTKSLRLWARLQDTQGIFRGRFLKGLALQTYIRLSVKQHGLVGVTACEIIIQTIKGSPAWSFVAHHSHSLESYEEQYSIERKCVRVVCRGCKD